MQVKEAANISRCGSKNSKRAERSSSCGLRQVRGYLEKELQEWKKVGTKKQVPSTKAPSLPEDDFNDSHIGKHWELSQIQQVTIVRLSFKGQVVCIWR